MLVLYYKTMAGRRISFITRDLTERVGNLHQGQIDIIHPYSQLSSAAVGLITRDLYAKITNRQTSPFASIGIDVKPPIDEEGLSQQLLTGSKTENNSPPFLFANIYARSVERALTNTRLTAIDEQGNILIRHQLGFFASYCPPCEQHSEVFLLIVPATSFDLNRMLGKFDTVVYVYNPEAADCNRLSAYIIKKVKRKNSHYPTYLNVPIEPWIGTEMLCNIRNRMDNRGNLLSPVQTPLI